MKLEQIRDALSQHCEDAYNLPWEDAVNDALNQVETALAQIKFFDPVEFKRDMREGAVSDNAVSNWKGQ